MPYEDTPTDPDSIPTEEGAEDITFTPFKDIYPDPTAEDPYERLEEELSRHSMVTALHRAIKYRLQPREQVIIRVRYGLDPDASSRTLQSLGKRFGVSAEWIRKLEIKSLKALRRDPVLHNAVLGHPQNATRPQQSSAEKARSEQRKLEDEILTLLSESYPVNKHVLYTVLQINKPTTIYSYARFVKALHDLEAIGLVSCQRNERGTIIESVRLRSTER